jgi:hypothetical protein
MNWYRVHVEVQPPGSREYDVRAGTLAAALGKVAKHLHKREMWARIEARQFRAHGDWPHEGSRDVVGL